MVLPGSSESKESACDVEDLGLIPGSQRSPGEGNDYPLQYSRLENYKDRGAWWGYSPRGRRKSWQGLSGPHSKRHSLHWKPALVLLGSMAPSPHPPPVCLVMNGTHFPGLTLTLPGAPTCCGSTGILAHGCDEATREWSGQEGWIPPPYQPCSRVCSTAWFHSQTQLHG